MQHFMTGGSTSYFTDALMRFFTSGELERTFLSQSAPTIVGLIRLVMKLLCALISVGSLWHWLSTSTILQIGVSHVSCFGPYVPLVLAFLIFWCREWCVHYTNHVRCTIPSHERLSKDEPRSLIKIDVHTSYSCFDVRHSRPFISK